MPVSLQNIPRRIITHGTDSSSVGRHGGPGKLAEGSSQRWDRTQIFLCHGCWCPERAELGFRAWEPRPDPELAHPGSQINYWKQGGGGLGPKRWEECCGPQASCSEALTPQLWQHVRFLTPKLVFLYANHFPTCPLLEGCEVAGCPGFFVTWWACCLPGLILNTQTTSHFLRWEVKTVGVLSFLTPALSWLLLASLIRGRGCR